MVVDGVNLEYSRSDGSIISAQARVIDFGEIGTRRRRHQSFGSCLPYGCLVPRDIDGLLVAGRHISCDPSSHSFLREIPQCWLTGQAAGVAAGLAAAERCAPRAVPIAELQAALRRQQVLLRTEVEPALAPAGETAGSKS
jgi:hypothetical protein